MDSRESDRFHNSLRPRRFALTLATLLLGMLIGWLIGRSGETGPVDVPPTDAKRSPAEAQRTEQGAIAAATAFARVMPGPAGDEDVYRKAMAELAAPGWRERAEELAENAISFVQGRYGRAGRVTFNPIRYRVTFYDDDEASVDIWGVVLGSGPKLAGIEESWITATLNLLWVESEWKVRGQSSLGGPTPETLGVEGEAAVPSAVEGFEEYQHAPRP